MKTECSELQKYKKVHSQISISILELNVPLEMSFSIVCQYLDPTVTNVLHCFYGADHIGVWGEWDVSFIEA